MPIACKTECLDPGCGFSVITKTAEEAEINRVLIEEHLEENQSHELIIKLVYSPDQPEN